MAAKATPDTTANNEGSITSDVDYIAAATCDVLQKTDITSSVDYNAAETCDVLQKTAGVTDTVKLDTVDTDPDTADWKNIESPVEDTVTTGFNDTHDTEPHGRGEVAAIPVHGGATSEVITHDDKSNGASQRNDIGARYVVSVPPEVHETEEYNCYTVNDVEQDTDLVHYMTSDDGRNTENFNSANPHVVIFFGRKGSGRKTIARWMLPGVTVKEEGTRDMFTEMVSPTGDAAILVDLEPSLTGRHRRQTIEQYTRYFQGWAKENPDLQHSVHLLVFVFIRGCFTDEDLTMYKYMFSRLSTESYTVKSRIALMITHCEDLTAEAQSKVVTDFNSNPHIKKVTDLTKENIICVGFPNLDEIMDPLKNFYSPVIEESKKKVNMVLKQAVSVIENPLMLDTLFKIPNRMLDSVKHLFGY